MFNINVNIGSFIKQENYTIKEKVELFMDEKRKEELRVKENKLMMRQVGFVVLMIIVFIPYFKFCAYLSNLFSFNYFMFNFTMLLGIPLTYFAAKYLVLVIKKVI